MEDTMTFSAALELLKQGQRLARKGWNGKGMWVALTSGSLFETKHAKDGRAAKHRANEIDAEAVEGGLIQVRLLPHIDMRTASGAMAIGWMPSQDDMLTDDWMVV